MDATLREIFATHFPAYQAGRALPHKAYRAADAIRACRTAALGAEEQACPEGHLTHIQYHSCRHRSCPRCAATPTEQWVQEQGHRLLACDHYHVIFTLPHELLPYWQRHQRWFVDAFFAVVSDTLMTLLGDHRHLGATPGVLAALHTWGRTLSHHPHIHALVTGGGLSAAGDWRAITNGYLLPARIVRAVYRGKWLTRLQAAFAGGVLVAEPASDWRRLLHQLSHKDWNIRIEQRYAHGRGVMLYLSRYIKGGPLNGRRLMALAAGRIAFRYRDHRDGKDKRMDLTPEEFLGRLLWHVPEAGQHHVRHYGLYAGAARSRRALARVQLRQPPELPAAAVDWHQACVSPGQPERGRCRTCQRPLVRRRTLAPTNRSKAFSLYKDLPPRHTKSVQQAAQADPPTARSRRTFPSTRVLFFCLTARRLAKR